MDGTDTTATPSWSHKRSITPRRAIQKIVVSLKDVFIDKPRKVYRSGPRRASGGSRSGSRSPSRRTLQALRKLLRNCQEPGWLITLTYGKGQAPVNDKAMKAQLSRFVERVSRSGLQGVWVLEFTLAGIPHVHILVVSLEVEEDQIRALWAAVSGQANLPCLVNVQPVTDRSGLEAYLAKEASKEAPESYGNVGRWYGVFGGLVRRVEVAVVSGCSTALEGLMGAATAMLGYIPAGRTIWNGARDTGWLRRVLDVAAASPVLQLHASELISPG